MERKHEARTSLLSNPISEHSYAQSTFPSMDRSYPYTAGGYHHREGYTTGQAERPKRTPLLYIPSSKWQYMFSGAAIFQAIVALALEGYIFAEFQTDLTPEGKHSNVSRVVATYLSLFIFGFLYQLVLVYDALRLKNTIQIIGLCLYNLGLLIEAAVQYDQIQDAFRNYGHTQPASSEVRRDDTSAENSPYIEPDFWQHTKPIAIAMPIFLGAVSIVMGYIAWKLHDEFAWSIYKHISADLRLRRRFLSYQIYIALLKFDFFFFLGFTVQFLVVVPTTTNPEHVEFGLTAAAIPITIVLLFLAAFWTRRESLLGMLIIILFYLGGLAYFCFKLFRMYLSSPIRVAEYRPARHSLTTFAALAITLLVVTVIYATICTLNFNKGLKPHIMSDRQKRKRANSSDMDKLVSGNNDVPLNNTGPSRMAID